MIIACYFLIIVVDVLGSTMDVDAVEDEGQFEDVDE